MDLLEILRIALRRWYLTIPVFAVGALLSYQFASDIDPIYTAEGEVILVAPAVDVLIVTPEEEDEEAATGSFDESAETGGPDGTSEIFPTPEPEDTDDTDPAPFPGVDLDDSGGSDDNPFDLSETLSIEDFDVFFNPTNPFLRFSGSLQTTASAVARVVVGDEFRAELTDEGFTGTFTIEGAIDGPVLVAVSEANSPEEAEALIVRVVEQIEDQLVLAQDAANVPTPQRISSQRLTLGEAVEQNSSRNRVLVGGLAASAGAALAVAVAADALIVRWQRRRAEQLAEQPAAVDVPVGPPEPSGPEPASPQPSRSPPPPRPRRTGRNPASSGTRGGPNPSP